MPTSSIRVDVERQLAWVRWPPEFWTESDSGTEERLEAKISSQTLFLGR